MTAIVFVVGQKGELMSDMTNAAAIDLLDNLILMMFEDDYESDYDTALRMAIDALKTQADTDTVSRQAARMCLTGDVTDMSIAQYIKMVDKRLEQLPPSPSRPSVSDCWGCNCPKMDGESARPKGEWRLAWKGTIAEGLFCSECHKRGNGESICPNCKADMWIPVTERLPEGTVLATVETKMFKHKYICEAVWIPRWSKIADFDSWEDCSEYNEDEDEYYVLEGWYERIHNWDEYSFVGIEDKVIAWKPLPEPYNKVEKGT